MKLTLPAQTWMVSFQSLFRIRTKFYVLQHWTKLRVHLVACGNFKMARLERFCIAQRKVCFLAEKLPEIFLEMPLLESFGHPRLY